MTRATVRTSAIYGALVEHAERVAVLPGGQLGVRRPRQEDLDAVFAIHSDPRTNLHNPAGPDHDRDASAARLQEWLDHWDQHGFGYWLVELIKRAPLAHDSPVVGTTGVQHAVWRDQPVLNLYYRYAADHWGRGYATAGARHTISWSREHHPTLPVLAYTTLDNIGSQRTAAAAGLTRHTDLELELNGLHAVVFASHWAVG